MSKRQDDDSEEPEEVKQAWDELLLIQREQQRYSDIKYDLEQDLEQCKKKQAKLENVSIFLAKGLSFKILYIFFFIIMLCFSGTL